jgi:hypothetical protein
MSEPVVVGEGDHAFEPDPPMAWYWSVYLSKIEPDPSMVLRWSENKEEPDKSPI